MRNTEGLKKAAKEKSKKRENEVLKVIEEMKKEGEKINFASVSRRSKASKAFLYNNTACSKAITREKGNTPKGAHSVPKLLKELEKKDKLILEYKKKIKELENKLKERY